MMRNRSIKLSAASVKEMYDRLLSRELTQGEASLIYGISAVQVGRIARGESRAMETGAKHNPIPNFNLGMESEEIVMAKARARFGNPPAAEPQAPSLYSDPPPQTDDTPNGEALKRMGIEVQEHIITRVGNELDKLEKGD